MSKEKRKVYICPGCGGKMTYIGELSVEEYNNLAETDALDWECPKCGAEGYLIWDNINKESYVEIPKSYDYEEIYNDPENKEPDCCKACGGPYPDCLSSCKIFDN